MMIQTFYLYNLFDRFVAIIGRREFVCFFKDTGKSKWIFKTKKQEAVW